MNKYKSLTGSLIKYHRERLNMAQKELCDGICVVSHLSKIENNKVEASLAITEELFQRLGIEYHQNEDFIKNNKMKIKNFFYNLNYYREIKDIFSEMEEMKDILIHSPLIIDYLLVEAYAHVNIRNNMNRLTALEIYMDSEQLGWFYLLKGIYSENIDESSKKEFISRAISLLRNSYSNVSLMYFELSNGNFDKVIELSTEVTNIALNEGNVMALAHINFCMGNCYSIQNLPDLMLPHYERAKNILMDIKEEELIATLNYNMGATYLESGRFEESLYYLETAKTDIKKYKDNHSRFFLYHKLGLLYLKLDEKRKAKAYLDHAKEYMQSMADDYHHIYELMIGVAELQLDEDYLNNPMYLEMLERLCMILKKEYRMGFYLFHKRMLEQLYCHLRQYKKAYLLK